MKTKQFKVEMILVSRANIALLRLYLKLGSFKAVAESTGRPVSTVRQAIFSAQRAVCHYCGDAPLGSAEEITEESILSLEARTSCNPPPKTWLMFSS